MNAQTRFTASDGALNLTQIMREERIVGIHWDPALDRFTVHLRDYSCGGGATVGDALAQAKARSAER